MDGRTSSSDFASGELVHWVAKSFARQGLNLDSASPTIPVTPRIPLDHKRRLLRRAHATHGPAPILRAGLDMGSGPFHILIHDLTHSGRASDLFARWQRLETYFHSRHRVRLEAFADGHARLYHMSIRGKPPLPEEDLLIGAVLAGLLKRLGAGDVRLWFGDADDPPAVAGDRIRPDFLIPADPMVYRFTWTMPSAPRAPKKQEHLDWIPDKVMATPMARKISRLMAIDLLHRWTIDDLGKALAVSGRSLQRRLQQEGTSFSFCLASLRAHQACLGLATSTYPVTMIGFLAGYSDAAHFTREFKRRIGLTPSEYRQIMTTRE